MDSPPFNNYKLSAFFYAVGRSRDYAGNDSNSVATGFNHINCFEFPVSGKTMLSFFFTAVLLVGVTVARRSEVWTQQQTEAAGIVWRGNHTDGQLLPHE